MRKHIFLVLFFLAFVILLLVWGQGRLPEWNLVTTRKFILRFGSLAIIVYILLMVIKAITIMPPTMIMMVLSSILFGRWMDK